MKEVYPGLPESVVEVLMDSKNRSVSSDPLEDVMYKKIYTLYVDNIIQKMNKMSVYHCVIAYRFLSRNEKYILQGEFERKPDIRFGDNLLSALSWLKQYNNKQDYKRELESLRRITSCHFPELRRSDF
jgi:hypothetical protein